MRVCPHHIIANSTFSWWVAWLGERSGSSLTIAPWPWFEIERAKCYRDLLPGNWVRLHRETGLPLTAAE